MTRGRMASIAGAILLAGAVFAWNAVRQEREFRRLIAAGDAALTRNQTYEAIEAFSGALALKRDSMLAHLKRGDSYRRRGELTAALRDLREATTLDPTATRALELLGDVNAAMSRYDADNTRRFGQCRCRRAIRRTPLSAPTKCALSDRPAVAGEIPNWSRRAGMAGP